MKNSLVDNGKRNEGEFEQIVYCKLNMQSWQNKLHDPHIVRLKREHIRCLLDAAPLVILSSDLAIRADPYVNLWRELDSYHQNSLHDDGVHLKIMYFQYLFY